MVFRVDIGTLRPAKRLPDGSLRVDAYLTRTGVFEYRNPDGTIRREYRDEADVFDSASLESFELVPVTDDHPSEMVTPENAPLVRKGAVLGTPRRDGNHVLATLHITDPALISRMERGKRDVSCGYQCELDETPGISPNGERYDVRQRVIRGNHTAIVSTGRAGTARARMDAAVMVIDGEPQENLIMEELKKALADVAAAQARADAAEHKNKELQAQLSKAEGERDSHKERADKAEKARTDAVAGVPGAVQERVKLEKQAGRVLGDADLSSKTDRQVKIDALKADGVEIPAARAEDDSYIAARFDALIERVDQADGALGQVRDAVTTSGRQDAATDKAAAARAAFEKRQADAWKEKVS
jgi:uncharacterized protein